MKIKKKKLSGGGEFKVKNLSASRTNLGSGPIIIDRVPFDPELWEDFQRIIDIDREQKMSKSGTSKKLKKKKTLGDPVIIESKSESVRIPNLLRTTWKNKIVHRKNNILRDFLATNVKKMPAKITVGRTIVPDEIRKLKKVEKAQESKNFEKMTSGNLENTERAGEKSEVNLPMNLDETFLNDDSNPAIQNETSNSIPETLQILNEGELPHFYCLRNKVICIIEPKCRFSFHGKLKIQILYGAVKVYGAKLEKENTITPLDIYSPRGTSLVSIESCTVGKNSADISNVWQALSAYDIDRSVKSDFQNYIDNLQAGWAVVVLQKLENNLTNFLSNYCAHRLFPKLESSSNYSWSDPKKAEIVLQTFFYPDNCGKLTIDFHQADSVITNILNRSENATLKILLAGGKNVGKSTTARNLVNRLLEVSKTVIFIDFDIGQAEFTPSGCISVTVVNSPLLGPNFTHLRLPYYQLFIGDADVTKCLTSYIEGVRRLVAFFNECEEVKNSPVVVNTMGFCKAIGWDIMCYVIKCFQPTDVIQINSRRAKNNFDQFLTDRIVSRQSPIWTNWTNNPDAQSSSLNYKLHTMETQAEKRCTVGEFWNIEPHQQREIVMLAYLSEILVPKTSKMPSISSSITINEIVPYQVPFSAVKVALSRLLVSKVLSIMNGNIVALCATDLEDEGEFNETCGYPTVLIRAPVAVCYGFGILRGVDAKDEKLYINTPLSVSGLKHVNCLIGSMPVPSGLLQLNRPGLPYAGGECDLPTSRDPRRGYFRMRHRNDI